MTWTKFGTEFFRECIHYGLSDAMLRTHVEAIDYLYSVEDMSLRIPKRSVRLFTGSEHADEAVEGLVALGWWLDDGPCWQIKHHEDVVRQSIVAQQKQRATSKATSAKFRQKKAEENDTSGTSEVTRHVTRHADSQTDKHQEGDQKFTCQHHYKPGLQTDPWKRESGCSDCQLLMRKSA